MSDSLFSGLDLAYYGKLFIRLAGPEYEIVICDKDNSVAWKGDVGQMAMIKELDADLVEAINAISFEEPIQTIDFYKTIKLAACLLGEDDNHGKIGSILACHSSGDTVVTPDLLQALDSIAIAISRDYHFNLEIESMTGEITDRYEELNLVYEMGRMIKKYAQEEEVFQQMVRLCATNLLVDLAVFIRHDSLDYLEPVYHVNSAKKIDNLDFIITRLQSEIFNFIKSSKEPLVMCEKADLRREYLFCDMPFKLLAYPIQLENKILGMLVILKHDSRSDFTNSDLNLIGVMAEQCAILLRNRQMFHEVRLFTEQMAAALIESVDAKDPYTRGHSDRVNQYSMEIGQQMNLSKDDLWALNWASLLHDVGKIGVPDVVLTKPCRLTTDEYTLIKIHPSQGLDILKHVERLQTALVGVHYHHERIDGNGYPDGLSGHGIPLQARIIAVADTYDAMTSSRAYRPARPFQEAMAEIRKVAGSQLDEAVVTAWEEVVRQKMARILQPSPEE